MAVVGIIGGDSNETAVLFLRMCQENGQRAIVDYYKMPEDNAIPIVAIDENRHEAPRIWILQETTNSAILHGDIFVMNVDSIKMPPRFEKGKLITYGFNMKASVTASSVSDESLQVCIQRGFESIKGSRFGPQEFKTDCPSFVSPLNLLGAVAACAVCDVLNLPDCE